MKPTDQATTNELLVDIFCTPQGEAWRIYLNPRDLPPGLRQYFDADCEAYPVFLDFDRLDRYMVKRSAPYEKRPSHMGDMQITARGESAIELAKWLASELASGFRGVESQAGAPQATPRRGA
ncbi:MAG: hypothetical protein ACOY0T_31190 [Myxococcota bacterium]